MLYSITLTIKDGAHRIETCRVPDPKKKYRKTMRRSASFLSLAVLSVFVTVLLCTSASAEPGIVHQRTCQDELVGNSYDCNFAFFIVGGVVRANGNCVEFVTGGLSQNFDLVGEVTSGASDYGCACEITGSVKLPGESTNAFECVGDPNVVQLHGKVESNKLHGQGSEESGATILFNCKKRSTACP
jgi:hypothetical protein